MAVSVSKAGPYYTGSSSISFSSLRSNFRAQVKRTSSGGSESFNSDTSSISASDLLRITSTSNTNPVVPNATENANIVTSQSNWSASHFRNSIKFYYIIQSGTDTNFDVDSQSWNSNLNKNINKVAFIDGTCGSNSTSSPAATFNATAHNFTIKVDGNILGAGGRGGGTTGAPAISGEDGGDALSVSTTGNNVVVNVTSNGKIYGGGGGGEKGKKGDKGSDGTCYESITVSQCKDCPSCPSGWSSGGCNTGWHCARKMAWGCWGDQWWESDGSERTRSCTKTTSVSGGTGGAGGTGGPGRGYNNQSGSLAGAGGAPGGGYGGCAGSWNPQPQNGDKGEDGGNGGNWSQDGNNTTNTGSGGDGGDAIIGSGYSVTGSTGSSNIKGSY